MLQEMMFKLPQPVPKIKNLIAHQSFVRIQNGNIFKVGDVHTVNKDSFTYYSVALLDPITKAPQITAPFYEDGSILHGISHMLGITNGLRIIQIIEMEDFIDTFNLKIGDVAVLRNGHIQKVDFIEPYKWSPERLEIYSEDQEGQIMLYDRAGVCVGTLRSKAVHDDIFGLDIIGVKPTIETINGLQQL